MDRITLLERRYRRLLLLQALLGLALAVSLWNGTVTAQDEPRQLRVSSIEVVDPAGTVRVRVGGELPPEVRNGRTMNRPPIAGVLLYDETGRERGGYVTFAAQGDEPAPVALTLDTVDRQSVLFAAQDEGAALKMWHEDQVFDLRVDGDGPSLHIVQDGEIAFHEPPEREPASSSWCRGLRDALERVSAQEVRKACLQRHSVEACSACLR